MMWSKVCLGIWHNSTRSVSSLSNVYAMSKALHRKCHLTVFTFVCGVCTFHAVPLSCCYCCCCCCVQYIYIRVSSGNCFAELHLTCTSVCIGMCVFRVFFFVLFTRMPITSLLFFFHFLISHRLQCCALLQVSMCVYV